MKGYTLLSNCRICQKISQEVRDKLDKAILEGESAERIVATFEGAFPKEAPLNEFVVKYHKAHLMEYVATTKLERLGIEAGSLVLVPEAVSRESDVSVFLSDVATQTAKGIIDEDRVLRALIVDSYRDLNDINEIIASSFKSPKTLRSLALAKDQIKRTMSDTIQRSQELRLKVGGEIEQKLAVQKAIRATLNECIKVMRSMEFSQEQAKQFSNLLQVSVRKNPDLAPYLD